MIVPASGHQVRCIPWVQMGTFNKEMIEDGGKTKPSLPRVAALPLMTLSFFKPS